MPERRSWAKWSASAGCRSQRSRTNRNWVSRSSRVPTTLRAHLPRPLTTPRNESPHRRSVGHPVPLKSDHLSVGVGIARWSKLQRGVGGVGAIHQITSWFYPETRCSCLRCHRPVTDHQYAFLLPSALLKAGIFVKIRSSLRHHLLKSLSSLRFPPRHKHTFSITEGPPGITNALLGLGKPQ